MTISVLSARKRTRNERKKNILPQITYFIARENNKFRSTNIQHYIRQ